MRGRVFMLTPGFHPSIGGAEKQALELSTALRVQGWSVTVLTRRLKGLPARETVRGVEVRRLAAWGAGLVNSAVFVASSFLHLLRHASEYEAIHVHLAGSPAVPAALAGRLMGRPVVVKVGGGRGIGEVALSKGTLSGRLKLWMLRLLKPRFVAVTRELVEELREQGLGSGGLSVLPNGVDTRRYRPASPAEKGAARAQLGWPKGALAFLYVGRLAPEKRLDLFLKVFSESLKKAPADAFAAFVGSGPEEALLRREIPRWGLEGRVTILPPRPDIEKAYAAADVFVLPSVSEGLSNALLEAMACGLAVLASRVGGTAEAVQDGRSGLLFSTEEDFRAHLAKFLATPGLAANLGRAGREEAAARYDIEGVAKEYGRLYKGES